MRKLIIPEGKTVYCPVGQYRFHGPMEIPLSSKIKFPETYEDGTPLVFTCSESKDAPTEKQNSPISDPTHGLDNPESGPGDESPREDCEGLRDNDSLSECSWQDY